MLDVLLMMNEYWKEPWKVINSWTCVCVYIYICIRAAQLIEFLIAITIMDATIT